MVLEFELEEERRFQISRFIEKKKSHTYLVQFFLCVACFYKKSAVHTYKIVLHSQPLGPVLLQEPLEQLPAGVRHVGLEHGRLVQDVVVHLSCVSTVERRLESKSSNNKLSLFSA